MTWGSSWGTGGFGQREARSGHRIPNGQHVHACLAHSGCGSHGFGGHGFFSHHYMEHCPGCRRSRSFGGWGGSRNTGAAMGFVSLFFGGKLAKKSLWD